MVPTKKTIRKKLAPVVREIVVEKDCGDNAKVQPLVAQVEGEYSSPGGIARLQENI